MGAELSGGKCSTPIGRGNCLGELSRGGVSGELSGGIVLHPDLPRELTSAQVHVLV